MAPIDFLNLKCLNSYIAHIHFKMEYLTDVLHMLKPGVWVALVVVHHAYYSIPVAAQYQPYYDQIIHTSCQSGALKNLSYIYTFHRM